MIGLLFPQLNVAHSLSSFFLCNRMHFDELLAFAQFRTSPIGYEPFVEACMRKGNRELAGNFRIPKPGP